MKKLVLCFLAVSLFATAIICLLLYNGIFHFNHPAEEVRGVDVSHYQGEIDWAKLANHDIRFAFIKATEGSTHTDPYFSENWQNALNTPLRIGAYHFFSYDSPGITQAENFIRQVPKHKNMLPPVIDIEFYGVNDKNPPPADQVVPQLRAMVDALHSHYGIAPILYTTEKSYRLYIADGFEECDIWIRNVISKPSLSDDRDWTFWQYSNRHVLSGYEGDEKFIDMNVFNGTLAEFETYGLISE